jgi:hypothetical protein
VARRIATIGGIALVPGVSKNRRLYTREAIARMVARAQDRIEGSGLFITDDQHPIKVPQDTDPITQLTHHAAEDATENIVGRLTSMRLAADGSAEYTADIADTPKVCLTPRMAARRISRASASAASGPGRSAASAHPRVTLRPPATSSCTASTTPRRQVSRARR